MAAIGPGPFAAMVLSDMGAEVLRLQRSGQSRLFGDSGVDVDGRGRLSLSVDLKNPQDVERVLGLIDHADGLIEGYRPGVMERLGLGPDTVLTRNEQIVYGRMTGYGQEGPLAHVAGHDINYISLTGALDAIGRQGERPLFPLNLVGDYGGGGMLLAFGMVCGLFEARESGQGQIVDAAMVDGASLLMSVFHGLRAGGVWADQRGTNVLDSGAHFYEVYATADGGHIAVGAIEPQFHEALLRVLGLTDDPVFASRNDRAAWPAMRARLTEVFAARSRDEWAEAFDGQGACVSPVLSLTEAPEHPHHAARRTYLPGATGGHQPAPAPRFSRTTAATPPQPAPLVGTDTDPVLTTAGLTPNDLQALRAKGAIA